MTLRILVSSTYDEIRHRYESVRGLKVNKGQYAWGL